VQVKGNDLILFSLGLFTFFFLVTQRMGLVVVEPSDAIDESLRNS